MAFERFDTKSASEALDVLFDQAVPNLPIITSAEVRHICRESLKYNFETGERHLSASADYLRPLVSWNLERVPKQLPGGQQVVGYQVSVQSELRFAVLAVVVGDAQGHPGYMFGIRFWMTSDGLFVQGHEGFRTSLPESAPSERVSDKQLTARGNSIEEARATISAQIPDGMTVVSEEIVCNGEPQVLHDRGNTVTAALEAALAKTLDGSEVLEQRTLFEPQTEKVSIEAFDQAKARSIAVGKRNLREGWTVTTIHMKAMGRSGFLGIGKTLPIYEVEILEPAEVEIKVKPPVVVKATVGLPRIQKAVSIAPRFASALDALVPQEIGKAENQYTKLEMMEAFIFALVQQDVGWISYEVYGTKRQHRPVSRLRWFSSSESINLNYHSEHADGSQGDSVFQIVRLSPEAFAFKGTYGTESMEDICSPLAGTGGTLGGSKPLEYFLQRCGIKDVLEEALGRSVVDS